MNRTAPIPPRTTSWRQDAQIERGRGDPTILAAAMAALAIRWRRWVTAVSILVVAGLIYGFGIEPGLLVVAERELDIPRLDEPVTVAVLTDLHVGAPHIDLERLREVVDQTNAANPDIVVILGDLVIHGVTGGEFVAPEPIAGELGRLEAAHGVFAVLGNHDWWYDGERVSRALSDAGIVVLENRAVPIEIDGQGLWIGGVADLWTRDADVDRTLVEVPEGAAALLLTHSPDIFPRVPDRVSLTLAGHTHGGQVHVPLYGPPIVPSEYGRRYAAGHVVEGGRHLFVSTGVGTSILPVRVLVPPRIDVLHLR